ncbi:MAG: 16S rRNA (guanine(527)-N(7))-methyltransferase RsmG [Clostridia bacterium]|nr:16S rRNA (guanine(527)-N(7))-methyltransferase RsmG [Clostridia bacterium]
MEEFKFNNLMIKYLKVLEIKLDDVQLNMFYKYMNTLIEWNKVMNLTRIITPEEIIIKHFVDSLTVLKKVNQTDKIIDVGTGAGFPGIPIKIAFPKTKVILLDSLKKRINFLDEVIKQLNLTDIATIHGRAEDYGKDKKHREAYDIAIARAVAPLNILAEYLIPFVKIQGKCICMKGANIDNETKQSEKAIEILGGKLIEAKEFFIPETDIKRKIIEIIKANKTDKGYPRKSGIPTKHPL